MEIRKASSRKASSRKASSQMNSADLARMLALKLEYAKLTTTPTRMKAIYAEMTTLRIKTVGQLQAERAGR